MIQTAVWVVLTLAVDEWSIVQIVHRFVVGVVVGSGEAIWGVCLMIAFHLLLAKEVEPKVLIEVNLVERLGVLLLLAGLIGVHLNLHRLLACSGVRDEVRLELGSWIWFLSRRLRFLLCRWLCLSRLRFGLVRWLGGLSWLRGLSRLSGLRGRLRSRLWFLLFFLLFFLSCLVLIPLLKHLAHHVDGLV